MKLQDCQTKGWTEKGHKKACKVLQDQKFLEIMTHDFNGNYTFDIPDMSDSEDD